MSQRFYIEGPKAAIVWWYKEVGYRSDVSTDDAQDPAAENYDAAGVYTGLRQIVHAQGRGADHPEGARLAVKGTWYGDVKISTDGAELNLRMAGKMWVGGREFDCIPGTWEPNTWESTNLGAGNKATLRSLSTPHGMIRFLVESSAKVRHVVG